MANEKNNELNYISIPPRIGKLRIMRDQLKSIFMNAGEKVSEVKLILCSYLYWKMLKTMTREQASKLTFNEIAYGDFEENEKIRFMIREYLNEKLWLAVRHSFSYVETEMGDDLVLFQEPKTLFATAETINTLAAKILAIDDYDCIADLCCGYGSFLVAAHKYNSNAEVFGYELATESAAAAELRALVLGNKIKIFQEDVFSLGIKADKKFDKIFCHYPYGSKRLTDSKCFSFVESVKNEYSELQKLISNDWVFCTLIIKLLNERGGKAVCLMTNGTLRSNLERKIREKFVKDGLIESIIALPPRILHGSGVGVSLVVFSFGNKKVRMVDASGIFTEAYGMNVLSDSDIANIYKGYKRITEISKDVTIDELAANDFTLHPERYFIELAKFNNGVPFKNVIKHITRGVQWSRQDVNRLETTEKTNLHYVNVNHVNDGMIDDDLPCLSSIDENYRRYCLKNQNLIFSKTGWKIAVARINDDEKILVSNNFYIIDIDEAKANPFYIQAFFESYQGQKILRSVASGSAREFITVRDLENVEIPIISLKEQEIIAKEFIAAQETVKVLRNRITKARAKLQLIFEEAKEV